MKRVVILLAFLLLACIQTQAKVLNFNAAMADGSKPAFVLVYAPWAKGYQLSLNNFRKIEKEFADLANFVELDITQKDAAEYNKRYYIYPNLPYVIMFRNNGKIQRYVDNACSFEQACVRSRANTFLSE